MKQRGIITLVIAAATQSCSGDQAPQLLRLDVPISSEHHSIIIAVEPASCASESCPPTIEARSIDASRRIDSLSVSLAGHADGLRFVSLLYDETLEELGLTAGKLTINPAGHPLPAPNLIYSAEAHQDSVTVWSPLDELPMSVADVHVDRDVRECGFFTAEPMPLGTTSPVTFVVSLGAGALIGTESGESFFVDRDRVASLGISAPFYDAYVDGAGGVILAGQQGGVFHGVLEPAGCTSGAMRCTSLTTTLIVRAATSHDFSWIAGPTSATPDEIYAMDVEQQGNGLNQAKVFRLTPPSTSELVYTFQEGYRTRGGNGGIAYVGHGEAVAAWVNAQFLVRTNGTSATEEHDLPGYVCGSAPATDGFSGIAHVPGVGTVAGNFCGAIYLGNHGEWSILRQRSLNTPALRSIVGYEDGFVYADEGFSVEQYIPSLGFCDPFPPGSPDDGAIRVAVNGIDVVAAGGIGVTSGPDIYVRWLIRATE